MTKFVYLNDKLLPAEQATVSVFDRGFLFGDSVYEVIPVYQGAAFGLDWHLHRLERSLSNIYLQTNLSLSDWHQRIKTLLEANQCEHSDCAIYMQISRDSDNLLRKHKISSHVKANIVIMLQPFTPPSLATLTQGFSVITLDDIRWQRCDIKTTALLGNILLLEQAQQSGVDDAIMVRQGLVTESTSSNVFIVKNNVISTPRTNQYILGGITRKIIIDIAKQNNITLEERDIKVEELNDADEIWLASSSKEIIPVLTLNKKPVGHGQPGSLWHQMIKLFHDSLPHYLTTFSFP